MSAIANGLALHGGFIPYVGTFLTFSDYARNALRMAALMKLRSIFVFTHDSIGLGEDGPTHQAVEHAASLRLIPHLDVWRPCDTVETAVAWVAAIERADGPTALIFTRQNVPFQTRDDAQRRGDRRGGYVLADFAPDAPRAGAVIIATGSEVGAGHGRARRRSPTDGIAVRVVSMPCTSVFERQDAAWRASVLPPASRALAVEAGVTAGWRKYVGAARRSARRRASASTPSANRRPPPSCSSTSASPSTPSPPPQEWLHRRECSPHRALLRAGAVLTRRRIACVRRRAAGATTHHG